MASAFEIPLKQSTPQKLHVSLSGVDYTIWTYWNTISQLWLIDIGDTNEVPIVEGIVLVTGSNLLAQFDYLGIGAPGSGLAVATDGNPNAPPAFDNLGTGAHLYYIVP